MGKIILYSLYERFWHWTQALAAVILLVTGFEISYSTHFSVTGFQFAVTLHNIVAVLFIINAFLALFYNVTTGLLAQYIPRLKDLMPMGLQHAHYYVFGIFRGEPHPFDKTPDRRLLPLQKITYFGVLNFLLPFMIITGALKFSAYYNPALVESFGGLNVLGPLHRFGAWLFLSFLIVHVYMITTGRTLGHNMWTMITGYETSEEAATEDK